jgi:hypothetical protein
VQFTFSVYTVINDLDNTSIISKTIKGRGALVNTSNCFEKQINETEKRKKQVQAEYNDVSKNALLENL